VSLAEELIDRLAVEILLVELELIVVLESLIE
jgi:hypothetical protein